jgi:CRP-like cAMP-binding protein
LLHLRKPYFREMNQVPPGLSNGILNMHQLPGRELEMFFGKWKHWTCQKDFHFLREGQIADYIWFIESGSIRIYYKKEDREVTEWLALEGQFFLSITSFFSRTPSRLMIHTMEPSVIWGIHHNDFMRMADEYHEIEKLLRKMVTGSLILSQQRMESIQFETAHQRYQKLLNASPGIVQRVPMQYIASFLGITKETLSRIRGMQ